MINPRLPLFVSLLLALCNATEFKYEIDWARCEDALNDMRCFVKKSCIAATSTDTSDNLLLFKGKADELDNKKCDFGVHIRTLSTNKYLVLMQVEDPGITEPDLAAGISIEQAGTDVMTCKKEQEPSGGETKLKLENKGSSIEFKIGRIFCSMIVSSASSQEEITAIFKASPYKSAKPSLKWSSSGTPRQLTYVKHGADFWSFMSGCDELVWDDISDDDYVVKEADTSRVSITCPGGKMLIKHNGNNIETANIYCDANLNLWTWKEGATTGSAQPGESVQIGCIEKKFCTGCDALKLHTCGDGAQCKKFDDEAVDDKGCKSHKCTATEEWWTTDGVANAHSPSGVQCKKDLTGSSWFLIDANTPKKIDNSVGIACRKTKSCREADLTYKCPEGGCPDGQSEPSVNVQDGIVNCTTGKLYDASDSLVHPYPSCKTEDGTWQGLGTGRHYCQVKEDASADKQEAPSTGGAALYAVAGVFGVLLLVGLLVVIFFVMTGKKDKIMFWKKKKATSRKGGKSSKKSTKSTKSKESKSSTKKPSDSDPPEKASGKEGEAPSKDGKPAETPATPTTDIEKLQTDPNPSNPPSPGRGGAEPGAPGGPPKDGAAPAPKDGAAAPPKDGAAPPAKAAPPADKPLDNKTTNPIAV